MKKIHMIAALLAMLLPTTLLANSYNYTISCNVSKTGTGSGTVYVSDDGKITGTDPNGNDVTKTFTITATPDPGNEFSGWSVTGGTVTDASAQSTTVSVKATKNASTPTATCVATFTKMTLPSFSITFETSSAGTYTVDGVAPANKTGLTESTSVKLQSTDPNFLSWNVGGTTISDNPYTATCIAATTISANFLTADQVTSVTTISDLTSALSNAAYKKIIIPSGTSITVAKGSTVTVPAGKQLVVDGALYVDGTLNVSGSAVANGTISKCSKEITQTGDNGQPLNPYGSVKYWKTSSSSSSASITGFTGFKTHATIVGGFGTQYRPEITSSSKLIIAVPDSTVAVNHIKSIGSVSTSVNVVNDTLNSGMVILLGSDCVINGGKTAKDGFRGVVDCAGNNCSTVSGVEVSGNNGKATFLNCPSFTGSKVINITHDYFNCDRVTLSSFNAGGSPILNFYDCGTFSSPASFSASYSKGPTDTSKFNFYSGYYNSLTYKSCFKVYGGSYKSDPAKYIADQDNFEAVYDSSSKYYVVQEKTEVLNVAAINGTEYETLSAAIAAAGNGATISLIEGADLTGTTVEVPSSKNITIALDKHTITGGKIVNRGTLLITDITVANESNVKCDIENYGTLDLVFGTYTGAIANKAGTLTTHNGVFTGTLAKDGGTVNLKGGHFTADVTAFVTAEGYDVFKDTDNRFCVCELPNGTMYDTTVSSTAGYGATPYNDADFSVLYSRVKDNKTGRSDYSDANWKRLAQLLNFYQIFSNRGLDATIVFDRDVAKNSINLYAKSTASMPVDFKYDLPAGQLYRALSEVVVFTYGYYAKTYYSIFDENIKSVAMAVSDKSGNNNGTVCKAMIELWKDDRASDYSSTGHKITNTVYVAGQKLFTLGAGSNAAMIRPATGAATFYATLGSAMDAAADGGTVMLANDCDTALPLKKAGTYTFDTMGFAASDAVSVSDGLFVKSETAIDSSAKVLVPDAKATTYVVAQKVASVGGTFYDNLTEAVGAANGATVTLLAATDETITLTAAGQSIQLTVADGVSFNDSQVTTSATGCSVDKTVSGNVATYTAMKKVAESAGASYPSVTAAVEAAGNDKIAITVTANVTENVTLPQGKALTVTVNDGVEANITVTPADGSFMVTTTNDGSTTYEAKKITVEMEEPQAAAVEVTKIENGTETTVSDSSAINDAIAKLTGNTNVLRTDNTDKLDVLEKIEVTPQKIVLAENGTTIKSATFDVVPTLKAGQSLVAGQRFRFRLPVDSAAAQLMAMVYHAGALFSIAPVSSANDVKFIEVESGDFSPYGYELVENMVQVSDGFYQNANTYGNSTDFYITNVNGLKFFRDLVNGETAASYAYFTATGVTGTYPTTPNGIKSFHSNNMFSGKTVHLLADLDLAGEQWVSIGFNRAERTITDPDTSASASVSKCTFYGLFDAGIYDSEGNLTGTHVISNLDTSWQYVPEAATLQSKYQLTGLFGQLSGGTTAGVKNLVVSNATVVGRSDVGVIAGRSYNGGAKIENCHVIGNVSVNGTGTYVGGLVGECRGSIVDSSVDADAGSAISGYAYVGGLAGSVYQYNANDSVEVSGSAVSNTTVSASYSGEAGVGALVGVTSPSGTYHGNVVITGNDANDVAVTAPNASASSGSVGTLVGYALYDNGSYAIVADNTVSGTTSATASGDAVTSKMGAVNDNIAVGENVTFDTDGKITGGIFEVINEEVIAEGYLAVDNPDNTTSASYPLTIGGPYVAAVSDSNGTFKSGHATFAAALAAALDGETVTLISGSDTAISAAGEVTGGKTITVTGTAKFDWDAGWLMIGRGSNSGDGTLIFKNATITSSSMSTSPASTGINISGHEKGSSTKNDGTVIITNSYIECRYLVDKGSLKVIGNGTVGATPNLVVLGGFDVCGRPANETESGEDATAYMELSNGAYVQVKNINGLGVGREGKGVFSITGGSKFEHDYANGEFVNKAKGTVSIDATSVFVGQKMERTGTILVDATGAESEVKIFDLSDTSSLNGSVTVNNLSTDAGVVYGSDGDVTIKPGSFVAMVGETKYENLADAIYAAYNGGTVTLLSDVTVADWEQNVYSLQGASAGTAAGPNGLVIDGDGHTLTVTSLTQNSMNNGGYLLYKGNFTVKNITLNLPAGVTGFAPQSGSFENVTINGGKRAMNLQWTTDTVAIEGCTIANTSSSAFYTEGGTKVAVNDSIFDNSLLSINGTWSFTSNTVKNASADFGSTSVTFRDNDLSEATVGLWADNVDLSENYWGAAGDYESKITANNRPYTVDSLYTAIAKGESGSIQTLSNLAYKVKFVNFDGSTLFATNVVPGGVASYEGATPAKPGDETSAYVFSGWDSATIVAVTDAPQTYTAQFAAATAVAAVFELADDGATTNNYASYADLHTALEAGKDAGKTVALLADIDLAGVEWVPVGTAADKFQGAIDGNGKVISNLTVNDPTLDYVGLIGYGNGNQTNPVLIKDLTISNATITARSYAGALAGHLYAGYTVSNVTVKGLVQVTANYMVGGMVGKGYLRVRDSSIAGDEGSFVKGLYLGQENETVGGVVLNDDYEGDNVGGMVGHLSEGDTLGCYNCSASGLTVLGSRKVGGLVGTTPPEDHYENVNVHDITVGTTATAEYATAKKSSMEIGGVIGSYYNNGTGGVISGTVQDITIAELPTGVTGSGENKNISYGLVTGGNRGSDPASKLDYSALIAKGYDEAIYNNSYLINNYVAIVTDANGDFVGGYNTVDDALKAAQTRAGATVNIFAGSYTLTTTSYQMADDVTVVGETDAVGNNLVTINNSLSFNPANVYANGAKNLTLKNLNVSAAGGNALSTCGFAGNTLIEHCTLVGKNGVRNGYVKQDGNVTFKDCVITGTTYGIHFDGSSGTVTIDNCTITGWTSFAGTITSVELADTTFENGNYDYLRFYQDAVISNCTFNSEMKINYKQGDDHKLVISDSTLQGGGSFASIITETDADTPRENFYAAVGTDIQLNDDGKVTGGVFEVVDAGIIASGYISIPNEDSATSADYPLTVGGPYAAVVYDENDTFVGGYATFKAAIDAANASSSSEVTVKLLVDITEPLPTDLAATKTMTITTDVAGGVELNIHSSSYYAFTAENGCTVTFDPGVKITGVRQLGTWDASAVMNINNPVRTSQLVASGGIVNINPNARIRFYDDGAIHTWGGQYVINGNLVAGDGLTATVASVGAENLQLDGGYVNYRYHQGAAFTMSNAIIRTQFSNGAPGDSNTFPVTLYNSVLYATGSSFSMGSTSQGTLTLIGSRIVADGVTMTIDANDSVAMDWKSSIKAKNFANSGTLVVDMAGFDGTLPITIVETMDGAATLGDFTVINSSVGAKVKVDANGNLVVVEKYVAQIGSTKFETLADAIAEAEFRGEETTITLLKDITEETVETSDGNFAAAYIPLDVEVILDLNGHDIVNATTGDSAKKQYGIYNEGTLTIIDSADDGTTGGHVYTMNVARQGNDAILNQAGGVLTVMGGWFGDADCDKTNANLFTRGASLRNSGDVTLEGGHFTNIDNFSIDGDTYAYTVINLGGNVIVNDDTEIYGEMNGIFGVVGGDVTVNGGSFSLGRADAVMYNGNQSYVYYLIYAADGNATVNGGTWNKIAMPKNGSASGYDFAGNPKIAGGNWTLEFGKFDSAVVSGGKFNKAVPAGNCATDYSPVANTDPATSAAYPYTVVSDYEAQIVRNGAVVTPKGSLTAMISAAQDGDTITLLKDIELSGTEAVEINKVGTYTIDGNGHSITPASDCAYTHTRFKFGMDGTSYTDTKNYIVTNLTISGFTDAATYFIRAEGCGLTLTDCTITNNNLASTAGSRLFVATDADLTLDGCEIADNASASYLVDFNTNGSANGTGGTLDIDNCLFDGNRAGDTGLVYSYGSSSGGDAIQNTTFTDNTVSGAAAAVIYFSGAMDVTGCLFTNNTVTATDSSQKCGVLALGSGAAGSAYTDNAFVGNTLNSSGNKATIYVGAKNVDLSGNYWGDGAAPESGSASDLYLAKTEGVIYNTYATSYTPNANGNGVAVATVDIPYVAQIMRNNAVVGKYESLADAIAAAQTGDTIELLDDYTMTDAMNFIGKSVTLDLGGNTLKVEANVNRLASGGVTTTITNGLIDISGTGNTSGTAGIFSAGHPLTGAANGGNTINITDVTLTGMNYNGHSVFQLYAGCALNIENSTVGLTNCLYSSGGFVKSDGSSYVVPITIKNSTIDLVNTQRGVVDGQIAFIDSTVNIIDDATIAGDTGAKLDNGFNYNATTGDGACIALTNSTVTVRGGTGRGITLNGKDVIVADGSTLAISDMAEGDFMFKKAESENKVIATGASTVTAGSVVLKVDANAGELFVAQDTSTVPTFVAQIGKVPYRTFAEAIAAAQDGDTVTLLKNVELAERLFVNAGAEPAYAGSNNRYATTSEDKGITLDLNGKNITSSSNIALAGGSLNITGTGTISTTGSGLAPIEVRGTGNLANKRTLTIGAGVTLNGDYGLNVFGSNDAQKNLIDVTVNGTVNGTLFVLGNLTNAENEINIVVNGTVIAPNGTGTDVNVGIALNGNANVTVNNGATVSGDSGIEVRAGNLTVNGGTISATSQEYSYKPNGSGSTTKGAAIAVAQHGTALATTVTLNGGTLEGVKAIGVTDVNGSMDNVSVVATQGYTQSSAIPDDYKWVETTTAGVYTLAPKDYVAQIVRNNEVIAKYETLAEAILAAQDGNTIEILDGTWGADAVGTLTTSEALSVRAKSLTIQAASGASPKFTSNVTLGYDDSSTRNATMMVKGLAFENAQLLIGNYAQTTVEDCSFSNATLRVIESCSSNYNRTDFVVDQVTIKDCTFDGTPSGEPAIRVRNSGNLLITGNTVANSAHNGILLESNGTVNTQVAKTVVVTDNTITEWNAGNVSGGGRGIRADLGTMAEGSTVAITGNIFRKDPVGLDSPDFAKITNVGSGTVDLSGNDWNDMLLSQVRGNDALYTCSVTPTFTSVITTKIPVAQIGTTEYTSLFDAAAAVSDGDTITMIADSVETKEVVFAFNGSATLDLNGHTVSANDDIWVKTGNITVVGGAGSAVTSTGYGFYVSTNSKPNNAATLTIDSDNVTVTAGTYGVVVMSGGSFNLVDGHIVSDSEFAVCGHGTATNVTINISGGSILGNGKIAVYFPPAGALNISGGTITGTTAIYQKCGTMTITGGTILGTGTVAEYAYKDSGANATGDAVVLDNCNYPNGVPSAIITGGEFKSANANAVASYAGNGAIDPVVGFIAGGIFSSNPSAYVANGYAAVELTEGDDYNAGYRFEVGKIATSDLVPAPGATEKEAIYTFNVVVTNETGKIGTFATDQTVTVRVDDKHSIADITLNDFDISDVLASAVSAVGTGNENVTVDLRVSSAAVSGGKVTFEAHPEAVITVGEAAPTVVPLSNDDLADGATFSLKFYTGESFAVGTLVKITHKSADYEDEVFIASVAEDETDRYVPVTVSHFSTFVIEPFVPDAGMVAVNLNTGVQYESLAAAIAAVPTDGTATTITMLADVGESVTISSGKNIILDLSGHTITAEDGSNAIIINGGLTVMDSGTGGIISDSGTAPMNGTLYCNGGTLTVLSGKIVGNGTSSTRPIVSVKNGTAQITGGELVGAWIKNNSSTITMSGTVKYSFSSTTGFSGAAAVSGGYYNKEVSSSYIAQGYGCFKTDVDANCPYQVVELTEANATAKVVRDGTTIAYYLTVKDALSGAADGDTVVLLKNSTGDQITYGTDKAVTLDLNGKTYTVSTQKTTLVVKNGSLTITDSSQAGNGALVSAIDNAIQVQDGASLTIAGGNVQAANLGIFAIGPTSGNAQTRVNITGGTVTASGEGTIITNGDEGNAQHIAISISGGRVENTGSGAAIYNPNRGTAISVSDNAVITGPTGIALKGGTLNISGGQISGTGAYDAAAAVNSGFTSTGDAIYVEDTYSANGNNFNPTVTITGGTLTSANGYAAQYYTQATEVTASQANGSINISGNPTLTSSKQTDAVNSTALSNKVNIEGGSFAHAVPEQYCADGYIPAERDPDTGRYTVKPGAYVAQVVRGGSVLAKYETFTNALDVAQSGDTIQLLKDVEGVTETFELRSKNLTIDGQGLYSITAGENTEPRSVIAAWGGARNMFVVQSGNVTFKDITLDGGETHYYTFLVQAKDGTTTFDNVELLHGGEADSSGTAGVGYGAAVQVDGATILVTNSFYACTGTNENNATTGVFPFTALLYQSGVIHFYDDVTADIGDDLLLVGMVGAVDASTPEGKAQVQEMLDAMNVPAGYAPYTLSLGNGDNPLASFTGASPLGWNDIIDYGKDIMDVSTALGMEMDKDATPVEVGLLTDTALPETFTYEDSNLTINGNDHAISGTIVYTDNAGTMENVVMGTEEAPLVLDMTGLSEGKSINLGTGISATNVTIKVTEEQATTLGQAIVTWNTEGESEEDAASLESGVKVEIVNDDGDPVTDPVTGDPMEASIIWDAEMGVAYIGPCEARLSGPTHKSPIYTSLASAIARAADSGDTVTLLMDIGNFTGTQDISKSLTLDGAGHKITAAPVSTHRDVVHAWAGSTAMFKLQAGNITFRNITLDGDATHAYTFLVSADNSSVNLTTENISLLNGGELCGDANGAVVEKGAGYGAAIHLNNGAHLTVKDGFYADTHGAPAEPGQTVGMSDGVFPFTGILPEGGSSVLFDLTEDTNAEPTVEIGKDLLLVGMIGAIDSETAQGILDYMKVPSRFRPYTLTLGDGSAYAFTGASLLGWNEIIEYGKEIMDVSTAVGYEGLDKDTTPVEVGLLTDTELPDTFTYADTNFTVNGNGNALSGTIKYTDDAGIIKNIVLGTEEKPLILDLRKVTEPVEIGDLIGVTNVTVLMTAEQATLGQPVFTWNVETAGEPDNAESVKITVLESAEVPYNPEEEAVEKELVWDDEIGVAYIGPCEARLTGPGREPGYMDLTNAFDMAVGGDTVTLFWSNVTLNASLNLPAGTLLFATNKYELALGENAAIVFTNATTVFRSEMDMIDVLGLAGDVASGYMIRVAVDNWTNVYTVVKRGEYIVTGTNEDGGVGSAIIKVGDDWVEENVGANVKTVNQVEDYLNSTNSVTNMRKWEMYVLNQTAPFRVTAVGKADNAVSTTLVDPAVAEAAGFTVKYSLDETLADGSVKTAGTQQDSRSFAVPVASVTTHAFYRVRAHLTSGESTLVVDSANTIGVLKATASTAQTIVAVPWVAFGGGDVTVADLLRTDGLSADDELFVYNPSTQNFRAWTLGSGKTWEPTTVIAAGTNATPGDDASSVTVARGSGVLLKRGSVSAPLCFVGEVASGGKTALGAAQTSGSDGAQSWNLVASPSVEALDIANFPAPSSGGWDRIIVLTSGAPLNLTYKNGKWGYNKVEVNKNGMAVPTRVTEGVSIPAGVGFWYLNSGAAREIEW